MIDLLLTVLLITLGLMTGLFVGGILIKWFIFVCWVLNIDL